MPEGRADDAKESPDGTDRAAAAVRLNGLWLMVGTAIAGAVMVGFGSGCLCFAELLNFGLEGLNPVGKGGDTGHEGARDATRG